MATNLDSSPNTDVAIVGAGIAGLASAIRLAREGLDVTVYDRGSEPGGRARTSDANGFALNMGPHALYPGAEQQLRELGVDVVGNHPAVNGYALYGGTLYKLPSRPGALLRTGLLSPRDKLDAGRAFLALSRANPDDYAGMTISEYLDTLTTHKRVRGLLEAFLRLGTYANAPAYIDAAIAIRHFRDGAASVRYLHGGWRSVIDQMATLAANQGVRIRPGRAVRAISPGNEGFVLDVAGEGLSAARSVIITTGPGEAAGLIAGIAGERTLERLRDVVPAKAAVLDVGVRALPRRSHTFGLGIDQPFYLQVHSLYARLAPEGQELLSAAMYLPAGRETDPEESQVKLEGWLDSMQPGWREAATMQRFVPNLVVHPALPVAGRGRPAVDGSGIDGLYFAGDWAGNEAMLAEAALRSAAKAANMAGEFARDLGARTPALSLS